MAASNPARIELLAVMLVDLRATIDAEKRAVVSAQASAEEFRIGRDHQSLGDIADTLAQLSEQARVLSDGLDEARKVLKAIGGGVSAPGSPESSAV
jgi:hypothetical protein